MFIVLFYLIVNNDSRFNSLVKAQNYTLLFFSNKFGNFFLTQVQSVCCNGNTNMSLWACI